MCVRLGCARRRLPKYFCGPCTDGRPQLPRIQLHQTRHCVLLFQNTITTFYQTSAHCSPTPCFRAVQDDLPLTRATCVRSMVDRLTSSLPLRAWSVQATKVQFPYCDTRRLLVGCCSSLSLALPGKNPSWPVSVLPCCLLSWSSSACLIRAAD